MSRQLLLSAACAACFPLSAFAEEPTELEEVVVTAARLPAVQSETPGARVIDRRVIDQRGARFAADVLADVPGVAVARTGAFGGVAQARIRGAAPSKTLVLIDGVPVNDPAEVNGAFDFGAFDLGDVDRIEVLSGPQSSLWGSAAIGGVIAFTTREAEGLSGEIETGSFDTVRGRVSAGFRRPGKAGGLTVSHYRSDGVSAAASGREADGLETTTVNFKGRYGLLDGAVRWTGAEVDLDGFPAPTFALADTPDSQSSEGLSGFGRLRFKGLGFSHAVSLSASELERDTRSAFPSRFRGDRQLLRWQSDASLLADTLDVALGAEHEETSANVSTGRTEDLAATSAFVLGKLQATEAFSISAALRLDDTDEFGSETTGRLSAAWRFGPGLIVSGAYGTGFKAPSVSQFVCDFCFSASPFPRLKPETAKGYEAALGWRSDGGRFEGRVTAYRLEIEDQITYVFNPTTFESVYVNIAETATDGVELEGRAILPAGFDLTLAYAWTDARDETTGRRLLRNPEHAGSATLTWTGERARAALTVRSESDQDDAGGVRDGFTTAHLNAGYQLTERAEVFARIENLADETYQQVLGYGEPGRSAYLGVRLRY